MKHTRSIAFAIEICARQFGVQIQLHRWPVGYAQVGLRCHGLENKNSTLHSGWVGQAACLNLRPKHSRGRIGSHPPHKRFVDHKKPLWPTHSVQDKMTDAPAAAPAPKPVKAVKPKSTKPKKAGVDYVALIKEAIVTLKERGGSSLPAIKKALAAKKLAPGWEVRLSTSIKALVKSGKLVSPVRAGLAWESLTCQPLSCHSQPTSLPFHRAVHAWPRKYHSISNPTSNILRQVKVKASYKLGEALKKVKKAKAVKVKKVKVAKKAGASKPKSTKPKGESSLGFMKHCYLNAKAWGSKLKCYE